MKTHHKAIGYKDTEKILSTLREARKSATMENANFGSDKETEDIKGKTDLFRRSWIISPLDKAIRFIEARSEGRECKCYIYPNLCFHNQKVEA